MHKTIETTKYILTTTYSADNIYLHQRKIDIQKTHPQTLVAQLGQVFLHTHKSMPKGKRFAAQMRLKSLYTIFKLFQAYPQCKSIRICW